MLPKYLQTYLEPTSAPRPQVITVWTDMIKYNWFIHLVHALICSVEDLSIYAVFAELVNC